MSGLGDQRRYRKLQELADEGRPVPESARPKGPTEAELCDPLLIRCADLERRFKASRPRDWNLLHERDEAMSDAEAAGRSLRSIARACGLTHPTVAYRVQVHRSGGAGPYYEPEPDTDPDYGFYE